MRDNLRRRPRLTFTWKFTLIFAVVSLLLTLTTGFLLSRYLTSTVRAGAFDDAKQETQVTASQRIAGLLSPQLLQEPLTGDQYTEFDRYVRESILTPRIVRVKVWNTEARVIYSMTPSLLGTTVPFNDELEEALAGETVAGISDLEAPANVDVSHYRGDLLEVYTPIQFSNSPVVAGAVEIYYNFSPVSATIADIEKTTYIGIGAALGVLFLALVWLVQRGSQTMDRQKSALQESYDSIRRVLSRALDIRDRATEGHSQRVASVASLLAQEMGLPGDEVKKVEQAAMLHDIGKIGVADAVLSKPSALNEEEWEEMHRHPELGYHILLDIEPLEEAARIVHAHHEHYNGSGYPRGLRGAEIPLGARIFTVVDAYDAITSHRPYRQARSHAEAIDEIERCSGTQFDPRVVKAFRELWTRLHEHDRSDGSHSEGTVEPGDSAARRSERRSTLSPPPRYPTTMASGSRSPRPRVWKPSWAGSQLAGVVRLAATATAP